MAPITQLSVLAFASAVLAVPHAHWEPLKRHAHPGPPAYGSAPPAYGASTSSAEPVGSSAPPAYGSTSSEAGAVSSSGLAGYTASSVVAPVSSSGIPAYGSSSGGPVGYASGSSSSVVAAASSSGLTGYEPSGTYSFSAVPSSGYAGPTGGYAHPTGSYGFGSTAVAQPTGYSTGSYPSGSASYSTCTETSTLIYRSTTEYSTYHVTHTIYPGGSSAGAGSSPASYPTEPAGSSPAGSAPAGSSPAGYPTPSGASISPASASGPAEGSCVPDVTITTTEKKTIYVTAGGAPTPSNTYPASWEPAPTPSSPASAPTTSYAASWEPAPTPTSTQSAEPSTYAAPPPSSPAASSSEPSSPAPAPSSSAPATSSSAPEPSSPPSYGSSGYAGKRGLAYNDASLTNMFATSSYVGWAYNWESDNKGLDSGVPYIPTLWGTDSMWTSVWDANAASALGNGAKYFFSFNEPDMVSQANLTPEAAAAAWKVYMEPYAGKVKLVAPGVTNGEGDGLGVEWLQSFLTACSDCTIDAIAQHWYWGTNDSSMFKKQIQATIDQFNKPIWVNEFGAVGTDAEKTTFLEDVMSWMDGNNDILGYAYFMVSDGLLCNGDAPSAYGATYAGSS